MNVKVHHWRHETGEPEPAPAHLHNIYPSGFKDVVPAGWYCWAYPSDDREFEKWMKINCPTTNIQHRFNSGDPMYTVQIHNAQEAVIFKLQWM